MTVSAYLKDTLFWVVGGWIVLASLLVTAGIGWQSYWLTQRVAVIEATLEAKLGPHTPSDVYRRVEQLSEDLRAGRACCRPCAE